MMLVLCAIVCAIAVPFVGAQRNPYSLQAAIDELHRREAAKYPLNAPPGAGNSDDYWDEDTALARQTSDGYRNDRNYRRRINSALARYLQREQDDGNDGFSLNIGPFAGGWEFDADNNINNNNHNNQNNNLNNNNQLFLNALSSEKQQEAALMQQKQQQQQQKQQIPSISRYHAEQRLRGMEAQKRTSSFFRDRHEKTATDTPSGVVAPVSVFRERESQVNGNTNGPTTTVTNNAEHSELTDQFLREIEETQEHEREERYKEALRHLWEKYQQQENELEGDLFEEKQKRMRVPPYYMLMQKKRSYPVLPWLPYQAEMRKKRFPVAKRSTKRSPAPFAETSNSDSLGKTDDRVAEELSELFGPSIDETKEKRSIESSTTSVSSGGGTGDMKMEITSNATPDQIDKHNEHQTSLVSTATTSSTIAKEKSNEKHNDDHHSSSSSSSSGHKHKHRKRSDHHHSSSHEHETHPEHEHDHESREETDSEEYERTHEHELEEEEEEDEEDNDESDEHDEEGNSQSKKKKKKRAVVSKHNGDGGTSENFGPLQISPDNLSNMRRKKSIEWSKYFGLDRKKKSVKHENEDKSSLDMKKRSTGLEEESSNSESDDKKKRDLDPSKLESMDKKLQSIEDFIISETVKYTGAHEGISNPEEIRRLKDHVVSRLATAYSLEKMRRALDRLRQSVDNENHLLRNVIEPEMSNSIDDSDLIEYKKRLSVKKERAPGTYDESHLTKEYHLNRNGNSDNNDDESDDEDDKRRKKMKKRNGYLRYPELPNDFGSDFGDELSVGHYEPLNDAYLGNKNYIIGSNQCPLIEAMAERCRSVDLLSGDINQELLPMCGVHQICYLCGTSQSACDYQYLAEADSICGNSNECLAAARSVLMVLRGTPGPQLGPRECLKNSCLYSAMREIGL